MHKAFINGLEGDLLSLFKAADDVVNVVLLDDDNVPVDLTDSVLTLEVYDTEDRRNAAVKSLAVTVAAPTAGKGICTVADTQMDFGPGKYYVFTQVIFTDTVPDPDADPVTTLSRYVTLLDVK